MALPAYPTTDTAGKRIPNPARPLKEGIKANVLVTAFDSGHEQRRKKGATRQTWELTYPALLQKAYDTLKTFWLARLTVEAFTWTHPITKVVYTVRFENDTWQGDNVLHDKKLGPIWTLNLKLIEVV